MEYLRCKCTQAVPCFIPGKMRTHEKHSTATITNKTRPAGSSEPVGPPCRPGVLFICLFYGDAHSLSARAARCLMSLGFCFPSYGPQAAGQLLQEHLLEHGRLLHGRRAVSQHAGQQLRRLVCGHLAAPSWTGHPSSPGPTECGSPVGLQGVVGDVHHLVLNLLR